MYKVMIVDDEPIMREGMEKTIPWSQLGCQLVAAATDGVAALEMAKELRPHIIISDIKMPRMDGLSLLSSVRSFLPDVQFIIISGYDDFKFAQTALNAQACAYLLKPLVLEELTALLEDVTGRLDTAKQQSNELDILHQRENARSRRRLLRELIDHTFTDEGNYTYAQQIQEESNTYYTVLAVALDDFNLLSNLMSMSDASLAVKEFKHIIGALDARENTAAFAASHESICCVLSDSSSQLAKKHTQSTAEFIRKWLAVNLSRPATIGIGKTYRGILKVSISYLEALNALGFQYLKGPSNAIYFKDISQAIFLPHNAVPFDESALIREVETGNLEAIKKTLQDIYSPAAMQTARVDLMVIARSLLYRCTQLLQDYNLDMNVFPEFSEKAKQILINPSIHSVYRSLESFLCGVSEAIQKAQNSDISNAIQKAIKYVEANYTDSSLSLSSTAKFISFNPSYFSSIFSKHMGKSFIDYVTELRIARACDLLENTNTKISSISYMVGYSSQAYFSTRFREVVGVSPSQYRETRK